VHATEVSVAQKGLSILGNVADLNLAQYSVECKEVPQQFSYFNSLQEDVVSYNLKSAASQVNVSCTFVNDKLHMLYILDSEGSPAMTKISSSVSEMAQNYLSDYSAYTQNPLYNGLNSMLNNVDATKNSTYNSYNLRLQVNTTTDQFTTFSWIYTFNGVDAPEKCVALGYANGTLKYFLDTWNIYNIGSTDFNLSEKEAIAIALQSAKGFSYQTGSGENAVTVKDLKVTCVKDIELLFCDSTGADNSRGNDSLTLYPMWHIGVGLDKWYPGSVYGVYVDIWADTGQVRLVKEVFTSLPPELVNSEGLFDNSTVSLSNYKETVAFRGTNTTSVYALTFVSLAIGVGAFFALFGLRKRFILHKNNLRRFGVFKLFSLAFCFLVLSVVFTSISSVSGNLGFTVFGDRDYSKTDDEKNNQTWTAAAINSIFSAGGYCAFNYQGYSTNYGAVLGKINDLNVYYNKSAVVYFDHGIGRNYTEWNGEWHYSIEDNYGVPIFDDDIYQQTSSSKINFAFISTCMSARITPGQTFKDGQWWYYGFTPQGIAPSNHADGMPFAWTHRIVENKNTEGFNTANHMSIDGYGDADDGDYCYIGYPWGSASLSQPVQQGLPSRLYYMFVYSFFWYAIYNDISVNSALDMASLMIFNCEFGSSNLHNNFGAVWGGAPFDNSYMVVYGNGNTHLYNQAPTPPSPPTPSAYIYAGGYVAEFGQHWYINVPFNIGGVDFESYDGVEIYDNFLPRGIYLVTLPDSVEVFDTTMYLIDVAGHSYTELPLLIDCSSGTVVLEADYGFQLNFSATAGGSTDLVGAHRYLGGEDQTVNVTATPDSGYVLNYWLVDGDYAGSNPTLTVPIVNSMDVEAVFCPVGYETRFVLTVGATDNYNDYVPSQVWIDGVLVGFANSGFLVCPGTHTVTIEDFVNETGWGQQWGTKAGLWSFNSEELFQNWTTVYMQEDITIGAGYYYW
jgi:hypothetical protein